MKKMSSWLKWPLAVVVVIGVFYAALVLAFVPSHERDWEFGQEALPRVTYATTSSMVTIENYRDFAWTDKKAAESRYITKTVDLDTITGVDVFISHFDEFEGMAHIFLSFGFSGGESVVVSVETRREVGESFSPLLGILRQFEIIYVVGSEADIVGVRTDHRKERVYLYPTTATREQARQLFDLIMVDVNSVYEKPQMYNTLLNNCTNALTRRVEDMSSINFPLTWKTILPGYFDEVLYELGLIRGEGTFAEIKANHRITNEGLDARLPTYSDDIRRAINAHSEMNETQ